MTKQPVETSPPPSEEVWSHMVLSSVYPPSAFMPEYTNIFAFVPAWIDAVPYQALTGGIDPAHKGVSDPRLVVERSIVPRITSQ